MNEALYGLLCRLISIPSPSREEGPAADALEAWMKEAGLPVRRRGHNLWCAPGPADGRPVLLLNAHIDTVRPVSGWTRDPFAPVLEDGRLYGLGANDDGGSLVALLEVYMRLTGTGLFRGEVPRQAFLPVFSATAEEEVSGAGGIESVLPDIASACGKVAFGLIGEPTRMELAVAERGLMVLDCTVRGKSGHAARDEGENALYKALPVIEWFRSKQFDRVSPYLGPVRMSVTQIQAGTQHNVVPDLCTFVVDVRPNGMYTNPELLDLIRASVPCTVRERSVRIGSSRIAEDHPALCRARSLGMRLFGSPTTSNQALVSFPTVKLGPGDSARSHTADEYIRPDEIEAGVRGCLALLDGLQL